MLRLKLKKLHIPKTRFSKKRIYLYLALATGVIAAIWWLLAIFYDPVHQPPSAFYYKNLDLSLAAKARYTDKAITVVKDMGLSNNVRKELISFDVPKDGLSEYGLMTLPKDKPAAGHQYPVIILCHGYSDPQAYSTLESYIGDMDFYSQHGFAVVKPDYRGNGFSLTDGTPDGAYYSMSYNTDVMSLIAAVKSTTYLNKNDINLWGHSMGAYVALRAAVLSPDIKNVVLMAGPVGTPQDMYADYKPISDTNNTLAQDIRLQQLTTHGTPLSNPAYWEKASPLSYLAKIKAHIQIHVGTADRIVPPKFSADLSQSLDRLHITHQYFVYKGAPHGLGQQRPQIWKRSLNLFENNRF